LIEIINKQLLLQLVGYLCYWQMGFNSVFKGLIQLSPTLENLRKRQLPYCVTVLFLCDELGGVFTASGLHFCAHVQNVS